MNKSKLLIGLEAALFALAWLITIQAICLILITSGRERTAWICVAILGVFMIIDDFIDWWRDRKSPKEPLEDKFLVSFQWYDTGHVTSDIIEAKSESEVYQKVKSGYPDGLNSKFAIISIIELYENED